MASDSVRFTFVRHGESLSNRAQRWQGQGDSPLSELGRTQARALGKRLAGRRFDRVISSDLTRAVETASATGFAFERDASFREFDVGRWEGLTREEVEARYPDEIERLKRGEDIPMGGGESYSQFSARVDAAVARLKASLEPGQHALVVCHGGVIGTAVAGLLGLRGSARWPLSRVINTAITELTLHEEGGTLRVFNDARHLGPSGAWPNPEPDAHCVALVSGGAPSAVFGEYEAHYEAELSLAELMISEAAAERPAARLLRLLRHLRERHPSRRVSVAASAELIHTWALDALWLEPDQHARLHKPLEGSVCHVGCANERVVLFDYGVSCD